MIIDIGSRPPLKEFHPEGTEYLGHYRVVYGASERAAAEGQASIGDPKALEEYLRTYEEIDAKCVVIHAKDVETTFGVKITNEAVSSFCAKYGPRFIGFAGIDPHKGISAIRELEHAVRTLGLRGLNVQCFEHKVPINHKIMYPVYAKCIELDIPVGIHCSVNFSARTGMEYGRPLLLDDVMVHFPELRVIAMPPGFPWVEELIAVAWRHSNVYIGLTPVRPKYLAVPNSGYGPLLQYGNTILQDRMIFGTSFPLQPIRRTLEETLALPLKETVKKKWLYENAARVLGMSA